MTRCLMCMTVGLFVASPAFADVTITSQVTGKMGGGSTQSVTYVKGGKMRTDSTRMGSPMSIIIDVDNQKFISLNHAKKEATVFEMAQFRETVEKGLKGGKATATLTPNGETKQIAGRTCTGYLSKVSAPMAIGNDSSMTMVMSGPVFIAKGAPGSEDLANFYRTASAKGSMLSDPSQARAGGAGQGMSDLYKAIAEIGGVPYAMEISMSVEGTGPTAQMMSKGMGGIMYSSTVTNVSTANIPASEFDVPPGYAVKTK
jgi:hypothetical protein